MKAKTLKQILNTKRPVADHGKYIAVGSYLCHNLIAVDKETLKITYALDSMREGKASLQRKDDSELLDIWNKLEELISSGNIQEIINGADTAENPITVYSFDENKCEIVESFCEALGYPNVTLDGEMMYNNTHFASREDSVKKAIENAEAGVRLTLRCISEKESDILRLQEMLSKEYQALSYLQNLEKK